MNKEEVAGFLRSAAHLLVAAAELEVLGRKEDSTRLTREAVSISSFAVEMRGDPLYRGKQ